jgi:hypothetical protein
MFSLVATPFQDNDPIDADFWQLFADSAHYTAYASGGTMSRALRRRRAQDDAMSDIDVYVLCDKFDNTSLQVVCASIITYLQAKHHGKKILAFQRGRVYTICIEGIKLPLQISFSFCGSSVGNVYGQFDMSHVHAAYSVQHQQKRPVWCCNVAGWLSNIYEQSTFLMQSRPQRYFDTSRVAKAFEMQLPMANFAQQWAPHLSLLDASVGQEYGPLPFHASPKNASLTRRFPINPIRSSNLLVQDYLIEWRRQLRQLNDHDSQQQVVGEKRKREATDQDEQQFHASVLQRFSIDSRGCQLNDTDLQLQCWHEPSNVASLLTAINCRGNSDPDYEFSNPPTSSSADSDSKEIDWIRKPITIISAYFIPIVAAGRFRQNAGYLFGANVDKCLLKMPDIRKTEPQAVEGLYRNCIFARIAEQSICRCVDGANGKCSWVTTLDDEMDKQVYLVDLVLYFTRKAGANGREKVEPFIEQLLIKHQVATCKIERKI